MTKKRTGRNVLKKDLIMQFVRKHPNAPYWLVAECVECCYNHVFNVRGRLHTERGLKREVIRKLIRLHPDESNRQIGLLAGADHKTVGVVRVEMVEEEARKAARAKKRGKK